MIKGFDASNIRIGGGVHHLVAVIRMADPNEHDRVQIVVQRGHSPLSQAEDRPWLVRVHLAALDTLYHG
jgi:hypothetical protein